MDNSFGIKIENEEDIIGVITFEQYINGNWVHLIALPATSDDDVKKHADILLNNPVQLFYENKYIICSYRNGPIRILFKKSEERR